MTLDARLRRHRDMRVFATLQGQTALRALIVGEAVFNLEKSLKQNIIEHKKIQIVKPRAGSLKTNGLGDRLSSLVAFALMKKVEFDFEEIEPTIRSIRTKFSIPQSDSVCLFSGGVDSTVGFELARRELGCQEAVFCAHSDHSKMIRIVNKIFESQFNNKDAKLRAVAVPGIGKSGYVQLRGFLYFLAAAAWADLAKASAVIVTEVGPTMYQPKFAPFDRVTLTTHPRVLQAARVAAEKLLGRELSIITPFADLTKAEVMAIAPYPESIRLTHSCISQRFSAHDGTCYGCVVRRLASEAAAVEDVVYEADPVVSSTANQGNLTALLRFSLDFLTRPNRMEEFEVGEIEAYGKQELFRRFALDNFAALHSILAGGKRLAPNIELIYRQAIGKIRESALTDRLMELRSEKLSLSPSWSTGPAP